MADLWFRLAVDFPTHPKVIQAGPDAAWLAVCAMAYCRKHLTDGILPAAVVPTLAAVKRPLIVAARLVAVGLWEVHAPDAYLVHDFLHWNPSRSEVESKRDKWKDTKRTQRSVHDGQMVGQCVDTQETPHAQAGAPARSAHSTSVSSLPVVGVSEGSVRETADVPPVWREPAPRPRTLVEPRRDHAKCYDAPLACQRGYCLPAFLGRQWEAQLAAGQPDGYAAGSAVVARLNAILDATPDGTEVTNTLPWWREQWESHRRVAARGSVNYEYLEECNRLHGGTCNGSNGHAIQMALDAGRRELAAQKSGPFAHADQIAGFLESKKSVAS